MFTRKLAASVRLFLVGTGMAPFVGPLFARVPALDWFVGVADAWFSFHCERDPARMLAFGAVCARCLGIYAGMVLGALGVGQKLEARWLERTLIFAVLAMLADVASESLGWRPAWAPLRFGTGVLLGVSGTAVALEALGAWSQKPYAKPSAG
jgi:uncharacterized membrane protein